MGVAFEVNVFRPPGLIAAADLRTKQFYIVKMTGTGVNVCGDGEAPLGVLLNNPNTGEACEVETLGATKVIGGAAVTQGVLIASDANGKAVVAASGEYVLGTALTACGADLELFTGLLRPAGRAA